MTWKDFSFAALRSPLLPKRRRRRANAESICNNGILRAASFFQAQLCILAACLARGLLFRFPPSATRGRGECRVPSAPAASCALLVVSMRTSIHSEFTGSARHSRTQWFTAYSGLSPVIGFLATVACGNDFPRT